MHDPGKILLDVALAVALGGDCLADGGMLRAEPDVFGPVASDPAVSQLIDTLAAGGQRALDAIRGARSQVRRHVWNLAGRTAPDATVDLDGVLVIARSDKEDTAATQKKTFGHHPLMGFVDHGTGGSGEPVAALLRPGNARLVCLPSPDRPANFRPNDSATRPPGSGTRRSPDAAVGSPASPPHAPESGKVRQFRRRALTQDRG